MGLFWTLMLINTYVHYSPNLIIEFGIRIFFSNSMHTVESQFNAARFLNLMPINFLKIIIKEQ